MCVCACRSNQFPFDMKAAEPSGHATKSIPILKAGHQLEKVEMDVLSLSASPTPVCVLDEEENFFNWPLVPVEWWPNGWWCIMQQWHQLWNKTITFFPLSFQLYLSYFSAFFFFYLLLWTQIYNSVIRFFFISLSVRASFIIVGLSLLPSAPYKI